MNDFLRSAVLAPCLLLFGNAFAQAPAAPANQGGYPYPYPTAPPYYPPQIEPPPQLNLDFQLQAQTVCAKYMTRTGWSDEVRVRAWVGDGFAMSMQYPSMKVDPTDYYVLIPWRNGSHSRIKMGAGFLGLSLLGDEGKDQSGRKWEISTSRIC